LKERQTAFPTAFRETVIRLPSIAGISNTVDDQERAGCRNRRHLGLGAAIPSAVIGASRLSLAPHRTCPMPRP